MSTSSFQFLPGRKFSSSAIKETYRDFFQKGLSFWTEKNFDIPTHYSLKVFLGLFAISQLLAGNMNLLSWPIYLLGISFQLGLFFGLLVLMKEWLQAQAGFKEYLAFYVYGFFMGLPLQLISLWIDPLASLLQLFLFFWLCYCFYKTFHFHFIRYLILSALVFGFTWALIISRIISRGLF